VDLAGAVGRGGREVADIVAAVSGEAAEGRDDTTVRHEKGRPLLLSETVAVLLRVEVAVPPLVAVRGVDRPQRVATSRRLADDEYRA
jgi:hypothetical protein